MARIARPHNCGRALKRHCRLSSARYTLNSASFGSFSVFGVFSCPNGSRMQSASNAPSSARSAAHDLGYPCDYRYETEFGDSLGVVFAAGKTKGSRFLDRLLRYLVGLPGLEPGTSSLSRVSRGILTIPSDVLTSDFGAPGEPLCKRIAVRGTRGAYVVCGE